MSDFRPAAVPGASVLLALACLSLSACGGQEPARAADMATEVVAVTTLVIAPSQWSDTIAALGTVKARESVDVTAKVSETVQTVHFDSGDEVAAGTPLVTLSGQQQVASLAAAEAEADEADRLLRRQSELAAQQLIARASLDTQRAIRDSARARVQEIRANLGDRTIRAPFAGVLGIRQVSPGALVTPGTVIASLDDVARVFVDFPVPEAQLAQLAAGQQLSGTSSAWPGRRFEGAVSIVDARIDPATRAVTVRGDFPNPDRALRPGMLMQVTLMRPARTALMVPEIAVVQVGNDAYVFRVKPDGVVERADVQVGARRGGQAEVVRGLDAGDRVVVDGTGKLRPGQKVRATGPAAPAAPAVAPAARP